MKKPPCKGCDHRTPACWGSCADYAKWKREGPDKLREGRKEDERRRASIWKRIKP